MEASGKRYLVYSKPDTMFRVWHFADLHLGNRGVAQEHLDADIAAVAADPCSFWFGGGDYADYIGIGDKRFDPDALAAFLRVKDLGKLGVELRDRVARLFEPVKGKCLGIGQGNHELMYENRQQQQGLTRELAAMLGAPYLAYSSFTDLVFVYAPASKGCPKLVSKDAAPKGLQRWTLRVCIHHGRGWAQTEGGKINTLVGFMIYFDADLTFVGHLHDQFVRARPRLRADDACETLIDAPQIGIMTGSYLRTYAQGATGYGEIKGYAPVPIGAVSAYVLPHERLLRASVEAKPRRDLREDFKEE